MAYDMQSVLTKLVAAGVLAFNSALAIRSSWVADDAGSMAAFVLAANVTLLLLMLFLCLRKLERARGGQQGGDGGAIVNNMGGQYAYAGLAKLLGLAVLTCSTALDAYDAWRDQLGSSAFVLVSYVVFVILTGLFIRAFSGAHAVGEPGQED